ncbi:MAG: PD40 domain-containing protein [Verrucomicrobiae bacterium]|nr:PD40 domain-containing protein [Verrucomicrobiae bacterium]
MDRLLRDIGLRRLGPLPDAPRRIDRQSLTQTPRFNEAGAKFSPDGRRLLYYRMPREEAVDNNTYGTHELVVSDADGGNATSHGKAYPWASWGPAPGQIACLKPAGIEIVDLARKTVLHRHPRQGIVEQLVWSPDGHRFAGTANGLGPYWNIGSLDAGGDRIVAVSETDRYNCTPDWFPDSRRIVYSRGIIPQEGGLRGNLVGRRHRRGTAFALCRNQPPSLRRLSLP